MICFQCKRNIAELALFFKEDPSLVKHVCGKCFTQMPKAELARYSTRKYACPNCGTTFSDYRKTALLGCEKCYSFFKDELMGEIEDIHASTVHFGKKPTTTNYELADEIRNIEAEIDVAKKTGNKSQTYKLLGKLKELELYLFGDGED